jgi:hypothetical protein
MSATPATTAQKDEEKAFGLRVRIMRGYGATGHGAKRPFPSTPLSPMG